LAAARGEDAAPAEFRGYPMKGCRAFPANGLDYRQDAVHMRIRPGFHGRGADFFRSLLEHQLAGPAAR
jgi:hypothetical protein